MHNHNPSILFPNRLYYTKRRDFINITAFYKKEVNCIHCKSNFKTIKIRSRFVRISSHETDFKPSYTNPLVNPLYYNVAVCPECGFSFTEDFSPYFAPGTKEDIDKHITSKWRKRSFEDERNIDQAIETYKLAYLCATFKKEKPLSIAGLVLRISWLYREQKNVAEEMRFMKISQNLYTLAYSEGDHIGTQMSEARVLYLIAELARRTGDEAVAIQGFSRVIEAQRTSADPLVLEMAKDRWQEIREEKRT
ncbi:DUF2225 domain-containing protein [Sporosarcina sp. CAU 1771]